MIARAFFMAIGLHGADLMQRFVDMRSDIGHTVLIGARQPAHAASHQQNRYQGGRHPKHNQRGQLDAGRKQHCQRAQHHQPIAQKHRKTKTDDLADLLGIISDARRNLASTREIEEGRREGQHMRKRRATQVGNDAFADAHHQIETRPGCHREQYRNRHHAGERGVQQLRIAAAKTGIDDVTQTLTESQHAAGRRH